MVLNIDDCGWVKHFRFNRDNPVPTPVNRLLFECLKLHDVEEDDVEMIGSCLDIHKKDGKFVATKIEDVTLPRTKDHGCTFAVFGPKGQVVSGCQLLFDINLVPTIYLLGNG